jgi:hypothetical protein
LRFLSLWAKRTFAAAVSMQQAVEYFLLQRWTRGELHYYMEDLQAYSLTGESPPLHDRTSAQIAACVVSASQPDLALKHLFTQRNAGRILAALQSAEQDCGVDGTLSFAYDAYGPPAIGYAVRRVLEAPHTQEVLLIARPAMRRQAQQCFGQVTLSCSVSPVPHLTVLRSWDETHTPWVLSSNAEPAATVLAAQLSSLLSAEARQYEARVFRRVAE